MGLFSRWIFKDTIEINTTPEAIWDFFMKLEENYISWHPEDHVVFKWEGTPMESGTKWYAEEIAHDHHFKFKGVIGEVIPNQKIVFKYAFPMSIVAPKFEWLIEQKNDVTLFTAISYLRAGDLFYKLSKKEMDWKVEGVKKHTKEEGENLKRILENE